jgi:alpha-tubulin suppressor-like RCC1 family protein
MNTTLDLRALLSRLAAMVAVCASLCACGGVSVEVGGGGGIPAPPPPSGGGGGSVDGAPPAIIAAGTRHTCVVDRARTVSCWGANDLGQLGNGTRVDSARPVQVPGLQNVLALTAGGDHSCALQDGGNILCWGAGELGQLGQGRFADSLEPVAVQGLEAAAVGVAAGRTHTCAVTDDGKVRCWGSNASGQLSRPVAGADAVASSRLPLLIPGLAGNAAVLGAGLDHTCVARTQGAPRCWGANAQGQLGNGTAGAVGTALDVQGISGNVVALAGGATHSCAILDTGAMFCWGSNAQGELGNGTASADPSLVAVQATSLTGRDYTALSLGDQFSCAVAPLRVQRLGTAVCWGRNTDGELGQDSLGAGDDAGLAGSSTPLPVRTLNLFDFIAIGSGDGHTCAIDGTDRIRCWGVNADGQLGSGVISAKEDVPTRVVGFL